MTHRTGPDSAQARCTPLLPMKPILYPLMLLALYMALGVFWLIEQIDPSVRDYTFFDNDDASC